MTALSERFSAVQQRGNLTISDLRRWFDRPYPTVRSWAVGYCQPTPKPVREAVLRRLEVLEHLVNFPPFPIPSKLGPSEHAARFRAIADAYNARVSGSNPAG